ncbi:MAG: polysaccharide deacetylase family protein [Gemmatimonadales bacterium]
MQSSGQVAALLYHHVGPVTEPACMGLTVTPEAFSRQMSTLVALGWNAITPEEWAAHVRGERDMPSRTVMITFDDAYADLAEHALPVLAKHSLPSTVFVPTSLVGKTIPCNPRSPAASLPLMSASQIREWADRGVSFGAHSRTHADLTTLDAAQLDAEVIGSRDDLVALTGRAVTAFAYPYGKLDPAVHDVVAQSYDVAFTIDEGLNDRETPLAALRRTMVQHGDSVVDVCLRARYGKSVLQSIRNVARGGTRPEPARS